MCLYSLSLKNNQPPRLPAGTKAKALSLLYSSCNFCNAQIHGQNVLHLFCSICVWYVISVNLWHMEPTNFYMVKVHTEKAFHDI